MEYKIKIRRGENWTVKQEAEFLEGKIFDFYEGWIIEGGIYDGEKAMVIKNLPIELLKKDVPIWIASGDLEVI